MLTVLLVIVYIAFISLGLPDAILGSAWTMIYEDLNVPVSYAGLVTMIITGGIIVSSSFLVFDSGLSAGLAAKWVSLYYLGITVGRFLAGFLSIKLNNKQMIRLGQLICLLGAVLLIIPFSNNFKLVGLILIGLGCAPIYPAMLHETPNKFGQDLSQHIMGIQMATAYVGSTIVPPLFGMLSKFSGFGILPGFLLIFIIVMLLSTERANKICK